MDGITDSMDMSLCELREMVKVGEVCSPWCCKELDTREISPGCSLEELMLKRKLQYFGHLMRRADSLVKTLMMRKIEGKRRIRAVEVEMVR